MAKHIQGTLLSVQLFKELLRFVTVWPDFKQDHVYYNRNQIPTEHTLGVVGQNMQYKVSPIFIQTFFVFTNQVLAIMSWYYPNVLFHSISVGWLLFLYVLISCRNVQRILALLWIALFYEYGFTPSIFKSCISSVAESTYLLTYYELLMDISCMWTSWLYNILNMVKSGSDIHFIY